MMNSSLGNTRANQQKMDMIVAQNASLSVAQAVANIINEERWQPGIAMFESASLVSRLFMLGEMAKFDGITTIKSEELAYDMSETAWKIMVQYRQSLHAGQVTCRMENDWCLLDQRVEALILPGFSLVAYPAE
jgi:hypothetical protein